MTRAADPHHIERPAFALIDPARAKALTKSQLIHTGVWIPGANMDITHMLLLMETVHYHDGRPIYTPHEAHPLGPTSPTTDLGLLVGGLMRRNRDMADLHQLARLFRDDQRPA